MRQEPKGQRIILYLSDDMTLIMMDWFELIWKTKRHLSYLDLV